MAWLHFGVFSFLGYFSPSGTGSVGCFGTTKGFGFIEPEVLRQAGIDRLVICAQMHPSLTLGYSR